MACLTQHHPQPTHNKSESFAQGFLSHGHGKQFGGRAQTCAQVKANLAAHKRLHHPQRSPPQAKGVRRAGGFEADGKEPHQTVQPVGQTDGHTRLCLR